MLFLLLLVVFFSIPAVQTKLASVVTDRINEDFGTNLVIKKVDLSLLGTVALKGIEIRDHHQDTLIFVNQLRTSLQNVSDIMNNKVDLGSVSIKGIDFHLKTYKDEDYDNLSIFVEQLEEDRPRVPSTTPFTLGTSDIYLEDLNFRQEDENDAIPLAFAAYKGGGSLQDFKIEGPNVSAQINGLYFVDNRGIDFTNVTTSFKYTKESMDFKNTIVKTPNSYLKAQIRFDYKRENLGNFNELVEIDAVFDQSYLSVLDLKKLYYEVSGNDVLHFTTQLHGSLNNFSTTDLMLDSDQGIQIYGDFNFINAVNSELGFFLTADIKNITANHRQLNGILPNLLGKTLPTEFKRLETFTLSGITKLTEQHIEATWAIDSPIGEVLADMEVKGFHNIDEAEYKGEVEFRDFDIGTFFNDPLFGKMSFLGEVDGEGFRIDNINSTFTGKIFEFDFRNYSYKDITVDGKYANNLFDGKLDVNDPNLKMKFEGLANISRDESQFDFNANISHANLKSTHFYERDSISVLEGVIDLDIRGNSLNEIIGIANFKNIKYKNQHGVYPFQQFLVLSSKTDSIKQIRIDSEDIIKGDIRGNFKFEQLGSIVQNTLGSMYSNYTPYPIEEHQFLDFDFTIYNQIVELFMPEVSVAPNTKIKGIIEADTNHLKLTASSPQVRAYGNTMDTLLLRTDNRNPKLPYASYLTAKRLSTPYYKLSKFNMINLNRNDTLFFKSEFQGGNMTEEDVNLDFYFTIDNDKKSVLGLEKSNVHFKTNNWTINPANNKENKVVFDLKTEEYTFSPFLLETGNQKIKFRGVLRDSSYASMHAEFVEVDLESLLPKIDSLDLQGQLNGVIDFTQKDRLMSPKGSLVINNFEINDFQQGDLSLNMRGENSYEQYQVELFLDTDKARHISATGAIDFSKAMPIVDLEVEIQDFQVNAFSPLGEDVLSSIRGMASGNFSLKGLLQNPEMNGELTLKNAGLQFPYLNVDYNLAEGATIDLDGQSFNFQNIGLKDIKYETEGLLNGSITHKNFDDWFLDLQLSSENLLVLDTQDSEEALYYGTGFIKGNASISGLTQAITIDVNAKTMPKTLFVIPLKDIASVDNYRLIHFKNEKKPEEIRKELQLDQVEGVDLDIKLEVTKDAIAQVVIDEVNGSELEGSGTGDLRIQINTRGKFNMFGDFRIDNGIYNLKYSGVINKPFKILKGGTISWDGNPFEANLNVKALYNTKANPAVLLENFNTNRKIDVNLLTHISGSLFNSTQEFDIEIPNANSTITSELDFILNNGNLDSKVRQFFSLLALNQFASPEQTDINGRDLVTGTTGSAIGQLVSDMISSDKVQVQVDYTSGQIQDPQNDLAIDTTVDVSLTTQVSDRVIINGKVGVPVGTQTQSSVVGEVKVEVLLNESGNFRGVIFNRQNEIQYSAQEEGYTQGLGLSYQVNFNSLSEFLTKLRLKKKSKQKKEVVEEDSVKNTSRQLINFKKLDH